MYRESLEGWDFRKPLCPHFQVSKTTWIPPPYVLYLSLPPIPSPSPPLPLSPSPCLSVSLAYPSVLVLKHHQGSLIGSVLQEEKPVYV